MATWKPGRHHSVPRKNSNTPLEEVVFDSDEFIIPLSGEDHVAIHRDEREVGPFGSLIRQSKRKLMRGDPDWF